MSRALPSSSSFRTLLPPPNPFFCRVSSRFLTSHNPCFPCLTFYPLFLIPGAEQAVLFKREEKTPIFSFSRCHLCLYSSTGSGFNCATLKEGIFASKNENCLCLRMSLTEGCHVLCSLRFRGSLICPTPAVGVDNSSL